METGDTEGGMGPRRKRGPPWLAERIRMPGSTCPSGPRTKSVLLNSVPIYDQKEALMYCPSTT